MTPEEVDAAVEEAVVEGELLVPEAAVETVPAVNKATKKKAPKKAVRKLLRR